MMPKASNNVRSEESGDGLSSEFLRSRLQRLCLAEDDDLASEVSRLAERNGRDSGEQLLRLVYLALLVEDVPLAELEYVVRRLTALRAIRNKVVHGGPDRPAALATPVVSTDPVTGLPVVESPPDAPIYSMTAEQFQALIDQAQLEDDLERVGLVVRQ